MKKLPVPAVLLVLSLPALASDLEDAAANVPAETVDIVYVVLFILLFVGGIAAFLLYCLWNEDGNEARPPFKP
jgi:hypothetical protein